MRVRTTATHRTDWATWEPLLGTMSDSALARKMGCSTVAVHKRRRTRGIPPFEERLLRQVGDALVRVMQWVRLDTHETAKAVADKAVADYLAHVGLSRADGAVHCKK